MNIWLIAEGEPFPFEDNARLMRMGMLANYLTEKAHNVIWWSSTFSHGTKKHLFEQMVEKNMKENERIILLHSKIAYKKNTSPIRMIYHKLLSLQFRKLAKKEKKPDIILCSWPTQDFAREAERYGKRENIPVILDARDEWPDIFERAFPKQIAFLGKLFLSPLIAESKKLFKNADSITGVTPSTLQWALKKARRAKTEYDDYFFQCLPDTATFTKEQLNEENKFWNKLKVNDKTWNICFYSGLSKTSADYYTVIEAVKKLYKDYPNIRLILCGNGDALEDLKKAAENCEAIVLPGWCNDLQLRTLLKMGNVGLYPFFNLPDFKDSISNKFVGYLAEGLPIVSSLQGYSKEYIDKYKIGITYFEKDSVSCEHALRKLLDNEELCQEFRKNSRERFLQDFEYTIVNGKFENLIKSILNKNI